MYFFGHRECCGLDKEILYRAIGQLICQGVDTFYVGNQGNFDAMVYSCLNQLRKTDPNIHVSVVLAYLPTGKRGWDDFSDTMYPEGIEIGPQRFAVERRNRWLVDHADYCLCYVTHTWGGAYKFAHLAKLRGKHVVNLGSRDIKL